MELNTFISKKSDGSKVVFQPGEVEFFGGLSEDLDARLCNCTAETENTSEIEGWDQAKVLT